MRGLETEDKGEWEVVRSYVRRKVYVHMTF